MLATLPAIVRIVTNEMCGNEIISSSPKTNQFSLVAKGVLTALEMRHTVHVCWVLPNKLSSVPNVRNYPRVAAENQPDVQ
jgi:hypothetical protein